MNTRKFLSTLFIGGILFTSCSSDDDNPVPVNEEELITKMTVSLVNAGETVTLTVTDEDGADGPKDPQVTVSGNLNANTTYTGSVELLNGSVSPAEIINEEIEEEADEHQFFYQTSTALDITTTYTDKESDYKKADGTSFTTENPVGLTFTLATKEAGTGTLTVTLRHQPNKGATGVTGGDITNAGGETDITQSFDITVQ
ncbi:type 1 periplasmic binding fold superfamily protein [Aquimarina aquimarini]|uniref:type 1 periplasmic binding fold superfamily protein n=1 Tax=Aquimarina aquimarini TaxID=1191734 RepID=UPI000D5569A0|nr:type 1 periplasmic binding fold superfamily protein [Aquimarina aquimarini]